MAKEFDKISDKAMAVSGARDRKYYSAFDEPPTDAEVAMAIKGMQGEVSDIVAYTIANTKLLVSIKQSLTVIAIAAAIVAAVALRFALVNGFWN